MRKENILRIVLLYILLVALTVACRPGSAVGSATPTVEAGDVTVETIAEPGAEPVVLRLGVSLTPQELETFEQALAEVDEAHPEWSVELELTPQEGVIEKINTELAANTLPDVFRAQGIQVQQWIRQDAFLELTPLVEQSGLDLSSFYPGPLEQFRWNGGLYGIPDTAAPDIVFYNKDMFDAAGLEYPTDEWTYDEMREAARLLTLDENGRNATHPEFDPEAIVQWGWNGGLTFFWQRHLVRGFGGDFCANEDCTEMIFTSPQTIEAAQWWADFTSQDHATLYDPYGGSQTGVPGDPFIAGKAAMGYNGFFAVGQLNDAGNINYDVVQPLLGRDGQRYTPLSSNGYVIAANSEQPEAAWELVQALTQADFLAETWGAPGHSVPALRAAAGSVINPEKPPANQGAIVAAMEYGEVFKPYTVTAFEVFGKTVEYFTQMMRGEMPVAEAMAQIEMVANETLAPDRGE
jgi:multiple sugar transport system substrate-binding protein